MQFSSTRPCLMCSCNRLRSGTVQDRCSLVYKALYWSSLRLAVMTGQTVPPSGERGILRRRSSLKILAGDHPYSNSRTNDFLSKSVWPSPHVNTHQHTRKNWCILIIYWIYLQTSTCRALTVTDTRGAVATINATVISRAGQATSHQKIQKHAATHVHAHTCTLTRARASVQMHGLTWTCAGARTHT